MKLEEFLEKWGYRTLPGLGQALFDFKNELKADLESLEKELPSKEPLSIEEITKFIEEAWFDRKPPEGERKIFMQQWCIDRGWINPMDEIFHCGNEKCVNCNTFWSIMDKAIREEFGKQEI